MKKSLVLFFVAAALGLLAAPLPLTLPLTLQTSSPPVQQTDANPCFYGGSNCQLPVGWDSIEAITGSGNSYVDSITYEDIDTASPYVEVFGVGSFYIGVDVNDTNVDQRIVSLKVDFHFTSDPDVSYELVPVPVDVANSANGSGWSDRIITFNGGAIPVGGATSVTFTLSLSGLNDGPDRFFIIPNGQSDNPIPEPATMVLLGSALVALGVLRRHRRSA